MCLPANALFHQLSLTWSSTKKWSDITELLLSMLDEGPMQMRLQGLCYKMNITPSCGSHAQPVGMLQSTTHLLISLLKDDTHTNGAYKWCETTTLGEGYWSSAHVRDSLDGLIARYDEKECSVCEGAPRARIYRRTQGCGMGEPAQQPGQGWHKAGSATQRRQAESFHRYSAFRLCSGV